MLDRNWINHDKSLPGLIMFLYITWYFHWCRFLWSHRKQCHLFPLWRFIQIWMALTLGQHSLISTWWHILLQNQQSRLKIMCPGFLALNCTRVLGDHPHSCCTIFRGQLGLPPAAWLMILSAHNQEIYFCRQLGYLCWFLISTMQRRMVTFS